jgi:hypothetical protein
MTTPAAGGHPTGWLVLTASERGAAHMVVQTPNQDAVASERVGPAGVVAVVADGHGHSRHLRSARGSAFAVGIGCDVARELADRLEADGLAEPGDDDDEMAAHVAALTESFLVPAILDRWRTAVLADVAADPFSKVEEEKRRSGDDPTIAYGSTLLLCLALGDWLILAQIGDGDIVGVQLDGTAALPVPVDPQLDGLVTTSLCGPDAASDFRVAVVDIALTPLLAVLLATDGYGNAQVADEWPKSFSKDLAWLLRERDTDWLAGQLPSWAARCASADGSADDTTVALLISPGGQLGRPMMPPGSLLGSSATSQDRNPDEITIPASVRTDTVPNEQVPPAPSAEPITIRLNAHDELALESHDDTVQQPLVVHFLADDEPARPEPARPEPAEPGLAEPGLAEQGLAEQETAQWEPPEPTAGSSFR